MAGDEAEEKLDAKEELNADDVARELANPNTALASLVFKNQFRFFRGDFPGAGDKLQR